MRGLGFNDSHVLIRYYESSFKDKKIIFPNCDLELKNYDFKDNYKVTMLAKPLTKQQTILQVKK